MVIIWIILNRHLKLKGGKESDLADSNESLFTLALPQVDVSNQVAPQIKVAVIYKIKLIMAQKSYPAIAALQRQPTRQPPTTIKLLQQPSCVRTSNKWSH